MKSVLESHALWARVERLQEENAQFKHSIPRLYLDGPVCQLLVAGNPVYGSRVLTHQSWSIKRERRDDIKKLSLVGSDRTFDVSLLVITTYTKNPTINIVWHQYYSFDCAAATAHVLLDDCEALIQIDSIAEVAKDFIAAGRKLVDASRESAQRAIK